MNGVPGDGTGAVFSTGRFQQIFLCSVAQLAVRSGKAAATKLAAGSAATAARSGPARPAARTVATRAWARGYGAERRRDFLDTENAGWRRLRLGLQLY